MNYVDTSIIALPLLGQEGASRARRMLTRAFQRDGLTSSALLQIELFRLARRTGTEPARAQALVERIHLVDISDDVIERACALTGELKSLDAIHLATAALLDDPRNPVTVLTHDARLAGAASAHGLAVVDPLAT